MYDDLAEEDRSFYGDLLVEEFDDKNNPIGVETPAGFYFYKIWGGAFDKMQDMISKFILDQSILSADPSSLDYFWGLSYNMPRPTLPISGRLLTDDEYRVYLYLRNCQLITEQDIIIAMTKCFTNENTTKTVYTGRTENYLEGTDHLNYTSIAAEGSNLHKRNDDETKHFVTNYAEDADTERIRGRLSEEDVQEIIYVPFNNWDSEFLEFLRQYISIKGTLLIQEY